MKVTVRDITRPDEIVEKEYPVDPLTGPPIVGDEIFVRERDYQTNHYLTGTVMRRRWYVVAGKPADTELALLVSIGKL